MKKLFSFLTAILFAASMMAAEELKATLAFDGTVDWKIPTSGTNTASASFTDGTYTIQLAAATNYKQNDGYLILGKANSTLTLPAFTWKTTKIVVTGRSGASGSVKQNIFVGETAVSTETIGATGVNEYVIAADYQAAGNVYVFKVTSAHNTQITEIKIYGEAAQGGETQPTTQDLYLKLSSDWAGWPAKYAIYYFNDTENNGWSEFMTAVTGEENTYTATIPVGYSKVIFVRFNSEKTATGNWDDKWSQTVDLTIPENKNHFTVTSGGTGSECDGVWAKYPVVPTYYVAGTMTSWADNMVEMNEGSYTFEGLAAGKYEIKVVDNNSNWLGFDKLNTTASNKNVYGEGDGNIKFVLGEEGDVTVAYDGSKITVTGSTIVAPTTVFTVTVPEGTEKAFIAGNFTKWAPVEMTLKEENVFTYSFAGDVADTASYKYLAGPDWKYVEIKADDTEADNRGYAAADEVAKWKAVPVALKYAKVTKAPMNWTGHYIISFADSKPHMAISADGKDLIAAADAPAFVDGDTISLAEGYDVEVRFSETAGAYTIKLPSEKYIKIPGSNAVNEDATAMALYLNYFKGTKQEGVQIADKNDFTSTGTRIIYKQNNYYRSYTSKIDDEKYVLPTLYRLVDEAFDCQDGPYAILVNGKDVENTVAGEEFDGYKQYVAYLSLTKGDSIQLINTSCGATWLPAIEEGGMAAHFKKGVNAATIDTTGCFDLYIKMKEGDDKIYIGAGICADDTVRYYVTGIDENWDEKAIASMKDTLVLSLKAGDYRFKVLPDGSWDGAIKGYDELTQKDKAGLKADNDRNICFTLKEAGDVTIVYNDTVFTVTGKFYVRVPEYKDLYLVPGVWAKEDAKIAAWIWTKKEGAEMQDQWTAFFAPKAEGNDTLTAKIDAEADSIVFVRFNKTAEAPSWEEKEDFRWNSIAGDTIDYAGLTYTITDWYAGTWKKYEPILYYIAGEGEGLDWTNKIASKQDTTVLDLKAGDYKLKVVVGEGEGAQWKGFEALTDTAAGLKADDDKNITFTLKEDAAVTIVYNDTVFTVTGKFYVRVPEYKDLYLVPGVWAEADAKIAAWIYTRKEGAEMADQWTAFFAPKAEGNDTLTAKIDSEADSILFVRFNKTVETPAWSDEEGVIWNKMEADTIDYAGLTYTITGWETGTWKVYVPETPAKFYITGDSALVVNAGLDKEKAWAPDAIKVTEDSYTFENLAVGDYKLKVTDGAWSSEETPRMNLGFSDLTQEDKAGLTTDNDNNICFTLKEAGNVVVTCKKVEGVTTFTVTGKFYVSAEPQGCDWENIEFLGDGSPEQTFGNQFKVCKEGDVPSVVNIQKPGFAAETGIYVTFPSAAFGTISLAEGQYKIDGAGMVLYLSAFTAVETEVTVVCESKEYTFTVYNAKGSAPVVEHTYTVAGDNATAFGTAWDPENAANDMVKQEDGTYKWEKAELTLAAGTVQFKVCEDHAWAVAYPASDYQLAIAEAGIYTITITFNPEGNAVNAVAAKTGSAVVIPTIAMHGNFTGSWVDTKNFTVAEDNETATLTMNLTVGNYEFGMRIGGPANWTANGVAFTLENTSAVVVAGSGNLTLAANIEGEYTFTWTYATSTLSIKFPEGEIVEPTLDNGYYVIGLNGWEVADLTENDMLWSTGIETGEYSIDVTLAVGNEFKVVYVKDDKIETWFPEGDNNNYKVDANHAGAKTIYFRPGYNGNEDWHAGCIYVAPNSDITTGINAINADAKAVKVLRNGQLLIIKGEKTYNGLGTLVR